MLEIQQTEQFSKWIRELRDKTAKAKVFARIDRLSLGLGGDKSTQSRDITKAKSILTELKRK